MGSADFTLIYDGALPNAGTVATRIRRTMRDWGNLYLRRLVTERLSGRSGGMGLNRRTGNLARDFVVIAEDTPVGSVVTVKSHGTGDKYAGLQEHGGTIRPVNAKWLWIPIAGNLTANGVARISPRQAIAQHGFIHKGVFFGESPLKSKDEVVPLFALKKSVKIPARMGATSLFQSMLPTLEIGIMSEVQGAWNG